MPIPATGSNRSNSSGSSKPSTKGGQVIELVISAKDEASQPIGTVGEAIDALKGKSLIAGKSFEDLSKKSVDAFEGLGKTILDLSGRVMPLLSKSAEISQSSFQKIWDVSVKVAGGVSILLKGVEDLYSVLSSPPVLIVFDTLKKNAEQLVTELDSITNIFRNISEASGSFLKGFTKGAVLPDNLLRQFDGLVSKISVVDQAFLELSRNTGNAVQRTQSVIDNLSVALQAISGFSEPLDLFESLQEVVGSSVSAIADASEQIFFFTSAIDQLKGVVLGGPFDLLIGQNIRLKEQLLATQSTLATTASYSQGGQRIDSTTQSILALAAPLKQVIGQIRKDSLELVGVTSNELVESFQLVTQSMTDVNINLKEAGKLSVAFAASLGTLGIPLYQARQEIQSILQGQIDQNSALAQSIGLTNTQLKSWISQDKVYERLTERLDAFVKGNKLAARTVGGLVSNIQELGEELGRSVGDKYLTSIESLVGGVYDFLVENQGNITTIASKFLDKLVVAFGELRRSLLEAGEMLAPLGQGLSTFLSGALIESLKGLASGINLTVKALSPFLSILGEISKLVATNPLLPLFIQFKVLSTSFQIVSSFAGKFINTIPLIGEGLLLLKGRSLPVVNAFSNLSNAFKGNIAAAVSVGAALTQIPGAMGLVQTNIRGLISRLGDAAAAGRALKGVPFFGGPSNLLQNKFAIEILSSSLASFTPQLLGFAKTGLSIASSFGIGRKEIASLSKVVPDVAAKFAEMTGIVSIFGKEIDVKGIISEFAPELEQIGEKGVKAFDTIDQKLSEITKSAGDQIRQTVIRYGLWAGAVFLVATATTKLVAQNEELKLAIEYVVDLITNIAEKVGKVLFSRIGLITQAVLGLSIALASGLIPALIQTTKSFIKLIAVESPTSFKAIIRGYRDFMEQLKNGNLFQKQLTDSVREGTEAIEKQVEAGKKFKLSDREVEGLQGLKKDADQSKDRLEEKKAVLKLDSFDKQNEIDELEKFAGLGDTVAATEAEVKKAELRDMMSAQLEDIRKEQEYYDGVRSELRERAEDIKQRKANFKAEQRAIDPAALEEADDLLGKTPSKFGYSVPGDPRPSQADRLKEAQDKLAAAEAKAQGKKIEEKTPVAKPRRKISREEMNRFLLDPSQVPASALDTAEETIETTTGSTSLILYQKKKPTRPAYPRVGDLYDGVADPRIEQRRRLKGAKELFEKERTALVPYTGSGIISEDAVKKSKDSLTKLFTDSSENAKKFASQIKTSLVGGFESFNQSIKKTGTALRNVDLSGMADSFKNIGKSLKTELQIGLINAKTSAIALGTALKTGVQAGLTDSSENAKKFASQIKTSLVGGFESFNQSIKKTGTALRNVDLSGMADSFKNIGKSLKTELQIGLINAKTSAIALGTALKTGVQAGLTAAGAGLTALGGAAKTAGTAVKALLIEFAPLIAIGAAIGVVVTALTNWAAGEQRKNAGIREYNERLKETITSLEKIKRLYDETKPPESRLTPETGQELEARDIAGDSGVRKLRALREERGFFGWIGEGISAKLGGGDIRSIRQDVISAQRSADTIDTALTDRLASDPFAKDGSGLNPEVMAEVRRNQELSAEIAKLNKEGKDDQARLKQADLESSNRRLSDLEKTFADNKEYLKGLDLSGEDAQRRDEVVDRITYALNQLAGVMEGTIAPTKMIEQGTGTALNLTQFNQARTQFAREGDPNQMERYASLLMGSAGELVQQGQLDPEEAIAAVRKVAESTGLDAKTTKAAQEQMVQFWEIATKRILQSEENRQSGLDLLRQKGLVSERQYLEESLSIIDARLEKQQEMSEKGIAQEIEVIKVQEREQLRVNRQELQAQEATLQESIANTTSPETKKALEADLVSARKETARKQAEIIKATEDEIRQLRLDYESEYTAMMIAAEKERQDARIKIVQEMQDRLNDQLTYSEEMRNQNLTRLVNERLIFEEEANVIRAESTDRRLAREIDAEKAIRYERMKTPALFEAEIRKSEIKIAQLTQQRIENEGKAWDAQLAALKRNLQYRVELFVNAIEEENKALLGQQKYIEAMQSTLDTRNQVLGTAKDIVDETADSIAGSYNAIGAGSLSQNTKDVLQNVAEIAKLETLQKSVELEKQMFKTQLAQNQLALQRQGIELQLKEIEEQRLVLEKKAALELAKKAAEEKPGDKQAQLDYEQAQREYDLQMASFGLTRKEIEMNIKEQKLAEATYEIRVRNKERDLQSQIAEQQAVVAQGGDPLVQNEALSQSRITGLMNYGLSRAEAERLARNPDELYRWARAAQQNGVANVFPQLQGMGFSFNDYTSNRGAQQQAVLNAGARFGATSLPSQQEAGRGYDAVYGGQIPANPTQTEVGSTFDDVNAILDDINLLDETVKSLGEGAIPTMEDMIGSASTLIEEQFPAFSEAMEDVNADKLPTATSVLDELGARLQTFSEEDLPGMQEAITGVQDTAVMGIDTIVLKLEEETTNLTNAIAAQFETVWQDILETIVLPPGEIPEAPPEERGELTPEQQAEKTAYDIESRELQIKAIEARIQQEISKPNAGLIDPASITLLKEEKKQLQEEIQMLRTRQAELPSFAPTHPAGGGNPGWWNRARGNDRVQVQKIFTANINVTASTAADANAIGTSVASFMRDVFYKTGEVTA